MPLTEVLPETRISIYDIWPGASYWILEKATQLCRILFEMNKHDLFELNNNIIFVDLKK